MTTDPCPIEGCTRTRRGEMCATHWRHVSPPVQAAVYATWGAWKRDFSDLERMRAYRVARDDARAEAAA